MVTNLSSDGREPPAENVPDQDSASAALRAHSLFQSIRTANYVSRSTAGKLCECQRKEGGIEVQHTQLVRTVAINELL